MRARVPKVGAAYTNVDHLEVAFTSPKNDTATTAHTTPTA
jgi:hypothetical protein